MKPSKNINAILLQMALIVVLCPGTPAVAQNNDGTTTSTTTTTQSTSDQLPSGSEFKEKPNPYNGMGEEIPVRKDAWTWYWNEKAHVDIDNNSGFWGNDAISNFFRNVSNSFVVPFWNAAMEYDFIRAGLLLVIAGMLLGFGASIVLPKKPESK
ncbi:MAG: hypothetical protein ACRD3W_23380 [Terriglobales bacterium]